MRLTPPLPIRDDWGPSYTVARGHANRDFAFRFADGHGAYPRPPGYHSAVDWFAPAGSEVSAPLAGRVFDSRRGTSFSGSVYGGVLGIERADGICVVMRHVQPSVSLGAEVSEGQRVASVSPWRDGWPHAHVEIWKSRNGGYHHANMLDPQGVAWEAGPPELPPPAIYALEELPHNEGGIGPVILGQAKGYEDSYAGRMRANAVASAHRARGRLVSTYRGRLGDGEPRYFALWWHPGTWRDGFGGVRFGPWAEAGARDRIAAARQSNTGRTQRRFRGRASRYPWPA